MKTLEEIADIRALINEIYEDCDEERAKSRDCFRNYCSHIAKELKALEIIKNKILCITSDDFFDETLGFKNEKLTIEEYDLLKEVLL